MASRFEDAVKNLAFGITIVALALLIISTLLSTSMAVVAELNSTGVNVASSANMLTTFSPFASLTGGVLGIAALFMALAAIVVFVRELR